MSDIQPLSKAVTSGYGFSIHDYVTPADVRDVVNPSIITSITGMTYEGLRTDEFRYDKQVKTVALPEVKSKTENGNQQQADQASQLSFITGSFGTVGTVMTQDWEGLRKVGGRPDEMRTEEDEVADRLKKINTSWDLHTELGASKLITGDTNLLALGGGSNIHPSYDYSLVINGASRAEETVDLAGAASDVTNRFTMSGKVREIQQELSKLRMGSPRMVCLCSSEFFQARYTSEAQLTINRELRASLDLGTSPIPMYRAGVFNYYNFLSSDGVWYIDVSGEIIDGQPLVAANKAFLFPMIAGLTTVKYSPSLRRGFAGKAAMPMYTFVKEGDFGISIYTESNRLYFNPYPQLIKALTLP